MPDIKYILKSVLIVVLFLGFSCDESPFQPGESDFYVTVFDDKGPLEGVIIQGGIDWDYYCVVTDNGGKALLPHYAYRLQAIFRKNNHYTLSVDEVKPDDYVLSRTPYILTEIGEVEGKAVRFQSDRIVTLNHDGEYRVYSYDENGVTEEFLMEFPQEPRWFRFQRDTLWFSAYDGGIYAYYIIDVFDPHLRLHLDFDRGLSVFDWQDSILAVASYGPGFRALEICSFHPDSSFYELYRLEDFIVNQIFFRPGYLVVLGFDHNLLSVFDISDPSDIRLAAVNYQYETVSSFLWGDTLGINHSYDGVNFRCRLFEFSDPVNPLMFANFAVDGQITEVINDTLAIGRYYAYEYDYGSPCIFMGSILSYLEAIAILSEEEYPEHQGACPPYFLISNKLWKLEER